MNYSIFWYRHKQYFPQSVLISEKKMASANTEADWIENTSKSLTISYIKSVVKHLGDDVPMFSHVEIETYNRCNGGCNFCPVSTQNETRAERFMDDKLFYKIIDELSDLDYSGRLALFSNNEPFLDDRIIEFHKYARKNVPHARMHIFTNGSKLTIEKLEAVSEYLDEIIIDNYTVNGDLTTANKKIYKYCVDHPEMKSKLTIVKRNPNEILTTRGGNAPNRKEMRVYKGVPCLYPFQQMIIRPDGIVSLCCNDPLGKCTMGDVNCESLVEIWRGSEFSRVRDALRIGREEYPHCKYCDTFVVC